MIFFSLSFTRDTTLKDSCRKVSKRCWRVEPGNTVVANDPEALETSLCAPCKCFECHAFRAKTMPSDGSREPGEGVFPGGEDGERHRCADLRAVPQSQHSRDHRGLQGSENASV